MDAVVIVDPIDYQRHSGESSDPPAMKSIRRVGI